MSRVDHVLGFQLGIRALELRDHVARVDRPQLVGDGHRRGIAERHRLEVACRRQLLQRVEILAGGLEQRFCGLERDPALDGRTRHVLVRRDQIELLTRLPLHDVETVTGWLGLVDDEHARRPLLRAHLVLVGPAAVVGHRPAAEGLRIELIAVGGIGNGRIVDEHHERLALHVHALVIVPVELGCDYAVAHEDELGILERRGRRYVFGPRDDIVFPLERLLLPALPEHQRCRRRRDPDQRHGLEIRSIRVAGFQAGGLELLGQVANREFLAPRARCASFELIRRQFFRVRQHRVDVDDGELTNRHVGRGGRRRRDRRAGRRGAAARHAQSTRTTRTGHRAQREDDPAVARNSHGFSVYLPPFIRSRVASASTLVALTMSSMRQYSSG